MSIKEILPSKQFSLRVGILCGIILLVIGIRYASSRAKNKPVEDAISAFLGRPTTPETIETDFLQAFWLQETGQMPNTNNIPPRDSLGPRDTATGALAKELFPVIALAQQTGGITPEIQTAFTETLKDYVASDRFDAGYEIGFFNTTPTTKESVRTYIQTFETLFNTFSNTKDPLSIIERAISSEDNDTLNEVSPILKTYQSIERQLLAMPVPTEALYHHVQFTNALSGTRSNIELLKQYNDDPVLALAGVSRYKNDYSALLLSLEELWVFFIEPKTKEYNL